MKTKLIIEIESPDKLDIFPEEGQSKEDFKGKEKELEDFREEYIKDLHETLLKSAERMFDEDLFEDDFFERSDEVIIEGYESFNDYGIKINLKREK